MHRDSRVVGAAYSTPWWPTPVESDLMTYAWPFPRTLWPPSSTECHTNVIWCRAPTVPSIYGTNFWVYVISENGFPSVLKDPHFEHVYRHFWDILYMTHPGSSTECLPQAAGRAAGRGTENRCVPTCVAWGAITITVVAVSRKLECSQCYVSREENVQRIEALMCRREKGTVAGEDSKMLIIASHQNTKSTINVSGKTNTTEKWKMNKILVNWHYKNNIIEQRLW